MYCLFFFISCSDCGKWNGYVVWSVTLMTEDQVQKVFSVKMDSPQDHCIFFPTMEEMWFRCIKHKRGSAFFSQWDANRSLCLCCLGSRTVKQQSWGHLIANLLRLQESFKGFVCFLEMKSIAITKAGSCVTLHVRLTFPNVHPLSQGSISTAGIHQQHAVWGIEWLVSPKSHLARALSHMSSQSLSPLAAATAVSWDGSSVLRKSWQGCRGDQWDTWCLSAAGQILKDFFSLPFIWFYKLPCLVV